MAKMSEIKKRILLVEDNNLNLRIMSRLLQKMDVDVIESTSDKEDLKKAVQEKYFMIFMCVFVPNSVGCEATKRIRENSIMNKDTPIIAVSSFSDFKMNDELAECGISDCISKPLVEKELNLLFQKYLVKKTVNKYYLFNVNDFELFYTDDTLRKEIISIVMDEKDSDLERINKAFDSNNKDIIYDAIHYMKGSFNYLKAENILELTQKILDLIKSDNLPEALRHKDLFISKYKSLIDELIVYSRTFEE